MSQMVFHTVHLLDDTLTVGRYPSVWYMAALLTLWILKPLHSIYTHWP